MGGVPLEQKMPSKTTLATSSGVPLLAEPLAVGAADRAYGVGERGPELFVPNSGGNIVNNADSRAALDRYTPNNSYSYNSSINATTGPVMQMNNEDYIRRADFERGLRQASDVVLAW